VRLRPLHTILRDRPDGVVEIDLVPHCILQLAFPDHGEKVKLHAEADHRQRRDMLKLLEHDPRISSGARALSFGVKVAIEA